MEPEHDAVLAAGRGGAEGVLRGAGGDKLPQGVPPLGSRWVDGDTFAGFTGKTLAAYY